LYKQAYLHLIQVRTANMTVRRGVLEFDMLLFVPKYII